MTGTDFRALERAAFERGMSAYERGDVRSTNPYKNNHATDESREWKRGYDEARNMALDDEEGGEK